MSMIRLYRVYYPVTTLGYGNRLGIWVRGCGRSCPGCLSPEMQPEEGPLVEAADILRNLPEDLACDGLTVSGGEPFDQAEAVAELAEWFRRVYNDDILIYTGYTMAELRQKRDPAVDRLLQLAAAVVDGPYVEAENRGRGLCGSENQVLHIFRHGERYRDFGRATRSLQCMTDGNRLVLIGVPPKQTEDESNDDE